jgi:hypothetical protein
VFENRNAARLAVFDFVETLSRQPGEYERRWHNNHHSRDAA